MDDLALKNLRSEIDVLDEQLMDVIAKRIEVVRKIGNFKKINNIEFLDEKRLQEILKVRIEKAKTLHLSEDFIKSLYILLHEYSLEVEKGSQ